MVIINLLDCKNSQTDSGGIVEGERQERGERGEREEGRERGEREEGRERGGERERGENIFYYIFTCFYPTSFYSLSLVLLVSI